jgi:hypothetical protein
MDAGIDPSFDARSLKSYAPAMAAGEEGLGLFIRCWEFEGNGMPTWTTDRMFSLKKVSGVLRPRP